MVEAPNVQACGSKYCRRFPMLIREFGKLQGQDWSASFAAMLGKAASQLYREIYRKDPQQRRHSMAYRNKVGRYPCGVLEQAYRHLVEERGIVPTVKPKKRDKTVS